MGRLWLTPLCVLPAPVAWNEARFLLGTYWGKSWATWSSSPIIFSYMVLDIGPKLGARFYGKEEGGSISVRLDTGIVSNLIILQDNFLIFTSNSFFFKLACLLAFSINWKPIFLRRWDIGNYRVCLCAYLLVSSLITWNNELIWIHLMMKWYLEDMKLL